MLIPRKNPVKLENVYRIWSTEYISNCKIKNLFGVFYNFLGIFCLFFNLNFLLTKTRKKKKTLQKKGDKIHHSLFQEICIFLAIFISNKCSSRGRHIIFLRVFYVKSKTRLNVLHSKQFLFLYYNCLLSKIDIKVM